MRVQLLQAAIGSGLGAAVPALDLIVDGPVPVVVAVQTDERPLLVSMLLAGRLRCDSGRVLVDGREDADQLRRRTALVDTPVVAEPTAGIALKTIVAEEFSFAGLPTSGRTVRSFLTDHDLADYTSLPVRTLPPADRIRLFSELAVLRDGVDGLVVTSPERHGGEPSQWYGPLAALAERGVTVTIVTDYATAEILVSLGARDGAAPEPEPEPAPELAPEPESAPARPSPTDSPESDPS
jgi:ABC-2 type transport system ATP-binding protein